MLSRRRKKAIIRFKSQITKLEHIKNLTELQNWIVYTDALSNEYIGNTTFHVEKFGKTDMTNLPKVSDPKFFDPRLLKAKKNPRKTICRKLYQIHKRRRNIGLYTKLVLPTNNQ